ncbi:MAG: hypothetical protein AAGI03_16990 [Pseudomonadota bacterium]
MPWPRDCPSDLHTALSEVLSLRNQNAQEVWGNVREWLVKHGVEAPDDLPKQPAPETKY